MKVQVLAVPYDSGVRDVRMGLGPERLLGRGLAGLLAKRGHDATVATVEIPVASPPLEIGGTFQLNQLLAGRVHAAVAAGSFPVVLAGNCNTAAGTLAGIGCEGTGVLWFDSHGDLNTPETTGSGLFDGMALAIVTGRCWSRLSAAIPGFVPVPDGNVVLAGARDLDPAEEALLAVSGIGVVHAGSLRGDAEELEKMLSVLAARVRREYVHLDLDVLDRDEAPANQFAAAGGPTVKETTEVLRLAAARIPVVALAITAYDPAFDPDSRAADAAVALVGTVLDTVRR